MLLLRVMGNRWAVVTYFKDDMKIPHGHIYPCPCGLPSSLCQAVSRPHNDAVTKVLRLHGTGQYILVPRETHLKRQKLLLAARKSTRHCAGGVWGGNTQPHPGGYIVRRYICISDGIIEY